MRRRAAATGALAGLAVVDALLVLLALRSPGGAVAADEAARRSPAAADQSVVADRRGDDASAIADDTVTPSPTETPSTSSAVDRVLVSIGRGGAAAWARTGSCGADAGTAGDGTTLRMTADGQKWRTVEVPVAGLLRVSSVDARGIWAVGTDKRCGTSFLRSTDGGKTWKVRSGTAGAWHLPPPTETALHAPDGTVDSPCARGAAPVDLAAVSPDRAQLLCPGGVVVTTSDGGTTWRRAGTAAGAAALAVASDDGETPTEYAAAPGSESDECTGVEVLRSTDGGRTWQSRGCVDVTVEAGTAGRGPAVALSFGSADDGLLATAEGLFRTGDGGRTWQAVRGAG